MQIRISGNPSLSGAGGPQGANGHKNSIKIELDIEPGDLQDIQDNTKAKHKHGGRTSESSGSSGSSGSSDSLETTLLKFIEKLLNKLGLTDDGGDSGDSGGGDGGGAGGGDMSNLFDKLLRMLGLKSGGGEDEPENGPGQQSPGAPPPYSPPGGPGSPPPYSPPGGPEAPPAYKPSPSGSPTDVGPLSSAPQTQALTPEQSKQTADQYVANLQKDFGLTKEQATGIVANLYHESAGMNSGINQGGKIGEPSGNMADDNANGYGLCQWGGSRKEGLLAYAKEHNLPPSSQAANYGFLKQELSGPYSNAISAVKGTNSAAGATEAFCNTFEKPSDPQMASRLNYAQMLAA
jgi:hypothetical protein